MWDWVCIGCGWVNYALRVRCRNCLSCRAAFHPDPEIDDELWQQWQVDNDFNASVGLPAQPVPGEGGRC